MSTLKDRLENDLHTAMKARDELSTATLRMALTAVRNAEVSGKQARTLTDEEVRAVLVGETKKRRDAAEAFALAGRPAQAERERAEEAVLVGYLPAQLSDEELRDLVTEALGGVTVTGKGAMGPAMKAAQAAVAGRAESGRVAAEVRRQLGI